MATNKATFRANKRAIAGQALLVIAIMGMAVAGAYIVFYEDETLRVAGRIRDLNLSGEPVTALLDLQLTNKGADPFLVHHVQVMAWTDESKALLVIAEELEDVYVGPGESTIVEQQVEIHNSGQLGSTVWVEWTASWSWGEEHHELSGGRLVDIGGELLPFTSS